MIVSVHTHLFMFICAREHVVVGTMLKIIAFCLWSGTQNGKRWQMTSFLALASSDAYFRPFRQHFAPESGVHFWCYLRRVSYSLCFVSVSGRIFSTSCKTWHQVLYKTSWDPYQGFSCSRQKLILVATVTPWSGMDTWPLGLLPVLLVAVTSSSKTSPFSVSRCTSALLFNHRAPLSMTPLIVVSP